MTLFIRLMDVPVEKKADALQDAVAGRGVTIFMVEPSAFAKVPGSPFAYWVSERIRNVFGELPPFEAEGRFATFGPSTKNDFRYLRLASEVAEASIGTTRKASYEKGWTRFAKGGAFAPFYAAVHLVLNWACDGHELKADIAEYRGTRGWGYQWSAALNGHSYYFRCGLTWPRRTNGLSFRALPSGCIFADKGPAAFVSSDDPNELLAVAGILNSKPFRYLVSVQLARTELAQSYEVGLIQQTPVPNLTAVDYRAVASRARQAWALRRRLDSVHETSEAYVLPASLLTHVTGFDPRMIQAEIARIDAEIDDIAFRLYGIEGADRSSIEIWDHRDSRKTSGDSTDEASAGDPDNEEDCGGVGGEEDDALLSWAIGVTFGRFDLRLATGERPLPPEPEPFDPLPAKSPGAVPDGDTTFMSCSGVLVDDLGHPHDLATRVTAVYDYVGAPALEPEALRRNIARDFFQNHIKMYSKSRRKAPIYWQLATPSASYSVWLYIHAFTKDTLFRVQNDYVAPKLAHEQRELESIRTEAGHDPSSAQRNAIAAKEAFVGELQGFLDEVKRIARMWNPNLDDGVIMNFAPLWRLVPQHKAWQRELKATWDALCAGAYDWAHLAMHLWPEQVVLKCAKDRSLAIAHGLEDIFWYEDEDGKWQARKMPTRELKELVSERTVRVVKDSVESLIAASNVTVVAKRHRKSKAA